MLDIDFKLVYILKKNTIMKKVKYLIGLLVMTAFTACHSYNEPTDLGYLEENDPTVWKKTHTISEFLNQYMTEFGDVVKYPPRLRTYVNYVTTGVNKGLFSVDLVSGDSVILIGRIVSSDVAGNVYKTLYIQDVEHPDQGIKVSVDAGSLSGMYPIGQKIAINCAGLAVGKYAKMAQIGVPYYNDAKEGLDKKEKAGWEVGRIPLAIFQDHIQIIGKPDPSKVVANPMTIPEICEVTAKAGSNRVSSDFREIAKLTSRLIKIENVRFTQQSFNYGDAVMLMAGDRIFAPSTDGVGYPQNRIFVSGSDTLTVGTSEYSKFANALLPDSLTTVTLTGIISFYDDNAGQSRYSDNNIVSSGAWSIVLRSLDDIEGWHGDEVFYPKY